MSIADELESIVKVTHYEDLSEYEGLLQENEKTLQANGVFVEKEFMMTNKFLENCLKNKDIYRR